MIARRPGVCPACKKPILVGVSNVYAPDPGAPKGHRWHHAECSLLDKPDHVRDPNRYEPDDAPPVTPDPVTPEESPVPQNQNPASDLFARAVEEAVNRYLETRGGNVDEAAVRAIVAELVAPPEVILKRVDAPPVKVDGAHYLLPRVAALVDNGFAVYLYGEAGSGKTTLAFQVAEALGRTAEIDTLTRDTSRTMVQGFRSPTGERMETPFTRCYAGGGIYVPDELDSSPAAVQGMFNSALANGHAPAAWGAMTKHDLFGFIGTGNTPLRPTPRYNDRMPGNEAFKDRLYFVHVPYDPNIERRATGRPPVAPPKRRVHTCTPEAWGQWTEEARAWTDKNAPTVHVTPRATLAGLRALAIGETPEEIAHALVFRGADDALTEKILAAVPLP